MTAVAGRTAPASGGDECVAQFPDLTRDDNQLLADAKKAFVNRQKYPYSYAAAKSKLIARIRGLQTAAEVPGQTGPEKLKLVARLIDFREVVRMFGWAPAEYLPVSVPTTGQPQVYSSGLISAGLPDGLKDLLELAKPDGSGAFLADVNGQARNIFLTAEIGDVIKVIGGADKNNGANEPATRSLIVDTTYDLPEQAAVIVHEAGHLEYTYRSPADNDKQRSERFADLKEKAWWESYLEIADLGPASRAKAEACLDLVMGRIAELNRQLGLQPGDLSPDQ